MDKLPQLNNYTPLFYILFSLIILGIVVDIIKLIKIKREKK